MGNSTSSKEANSTSSDEGNSITRQEFESAVKSCGFPRPDVDKFKYFKRGLNDNGFTDREAAMFLAQVIHESRGLQTKEEDEPDEDDYDRNDDGIQFYGRGYIQLTWKANYKAASRAIYGDNRLVDNPELVAESERLAWKTAFWFWTDRVRPAPDVEPRNFRDTTRAINGELEGDNPNPSRYRYYRKVSKAFGID